MVLWEAESFQYFCVVSIPPSYRRAFPILVFLGVCWAYTAYDRYHLRSYGAAYNPVRHELGLPLVGKDWKAVYSTDAIDFVNPNHQAEHTRKPSCCLLEWGSGRG
jgi:hypothetical protein